MTDLITAIHAFQDEYLSSGLRETPEWCAVMDAAKALTLQREHEEDWAGYYRDLAERQGPSGASDATRRMAKIMGCDFVAKGGDGGELVLMSIGDMAVAAAAQDVIREIRADNRQMREVGGALLDHIDALMPVIDKALATEWKRGNYINGPQFGATVEAFRSAITAGARRGET